MKVPMASTKIVMSSAVSGSFVMYHRIRPSPANKRAPLSVLLKPPMPCLKERININNTARVSPAGRSRDQVAPFASCVINAITPKTAQIKNEVL